MHTHTHTTNIYMYTHTYIHTNTHTDANIHTHTDAHMLSFPGELKGRRKWDCSGVEALFLQTKLLSSLTIQADHVPHKHWHQSRLKPKYPHS